MADDIWEATPAIEWLNTMREELDLLAGSPIEYDATPDGAWTAVSSQLAWFVDQGIALGYSTLFIDTAPEPVVVSMALDAGLTPKPGTPSLYSVLMTATGSGFTLETGAQFRGGGPTGQAVWEYIGTNRSTTTSFAVQLQCTVAGPTVMGMSALTPVTPITGLASVVPTIVVNGTDRLGSPPESLPDLRVRVKSDRPRGGGEEAFAAQLGNLPWVLGADAVTRGPGVVQVTISPGPANSVEENELAALLWQYTPLGSETSGVNSLNYTKRNGQVIQVYYNEGDTQEVAVVVTVYTDGTVLEDPTSEAVVAAIQGQFALLSFGDPILRIRIIGALNTIPGVVGFLLTLNGSTNGAIYPTNAADILTANISTPTVTVI